MTTILIKKKDTAGAPAAGDLTNAAGGAEIAVNTATKRIYTKDSGGNVVEVGTNPTATTMNGSLTFVPDATYDIGATGATRPRDIFMSRNLTVGGTMTVAGGINFNGNVTVGDSSADTLTINSTITSNLIFTDNTYDIGATGATRPRNLFLAGNATIGGAQTLTGALTLSGGTANGVLYLNGSKVATSGSLLVFDGTRLLVGKNTSDANNWGIQNYSIASAYASGIQLVYGGIGAAALWVPAANSLAFGADIASGTTELMRLNNTGLGIGTSTVITKLTVNGSDGITMQRSTANAFAPVLDYLKSRGTTASPTGVSDGDGLFLLRVAPYQGSAFTYLNAMTVEVDGGYTSGQNPPTRLIFYTNSANGSSTNRFNITGTGNVGLGATPAAWLWPDSSTGALQLQAGAAFSGYNNGAVMSQNWYYNAGEKFIGNGFGTRYQQDAGVHAWSVSTASNASGAGAALTWSEKVRINTSGQMMIGATSNDGRLLTIVGNTNDLCGVGVTYSGVAAASISVNSVGSLLFNLNNSDGKTTRACIDLSGNFGIGTTAPASKLEISGNGELLRFDGSSGQDRSMYFRNVGSGKTAKILTDGILALETNAATSITFATNSSEKMRISSSALAIGTTSVAAATRLNVVGGSNMTYWEGGNNSTNITSGTPDQALCKFSDNTIGNFWQTRFLNNAGNTMFSMGAQTTSHTANFNNGKFFVDGGVRATPETFIVDTTNEYSYFGYSGSNGAYRIQVNGQIFATSATIATSDGRYKENVQDLTDALELVKALRPVSFNWKKHNIHVFNTEDTTVGFIAQEVQQAMADKPYLNSFIKLNKCTSFDQVEQKYSDEEFLGLAETNMVAILTKALQELNAKFDAYVASHP
jgi:predicted heme/steroid binding protein